MVRKPRGKLVRWNSELNEKLLLAIQSACNEAGINLPWDIIERHMDCNATANAILQHCAKMRKRRASEGLSNPPPLRRGGRRDSPAGNTHVNQKTGESDSDSEYAITASASKRKAKDVTMKPTKKAKRSTATASSSPKVGANSDYTKVKSAPSEAEGSEASGSKIVTISTQGRPKLQQLLGMPGSSLSPAATAAFPAELVNFNQMQHAAGPFGSGDNAFSGMPAMSYGFPSFQQSGQLGPSAPATSFSAGLNFLRASQSDAGYNAGIPMPYGDEFGLGSMSLPGGEYDVAEGGGNSFPGSYGDEDFLPLAGYEFS